ncbi:hypothetical protein VTI74DRAFT_2303 [Chaetomium olivicolor]
MVSKTCSHEFGAGDTVRSTGEVTAITRRWQSPMRWHLEGQMEDRPLTVDPRELTLPTDWNLHLDTIPDTTPPFYPFGSGSGSGPAPGIPEPVQAHPGIPAPRDPPVSIPRPRRRRHRRRPKPKPPPIDFEALGDGEYLTKVKVLLAKDISATLDKCLVSDQWSQCWIPASLARLLPHPFIDLMPNCRRRLATPRGWIIPTRAVYLYLEFPDGPDMGGLPLLIPVLEDEHAENLGVVFIVSMKLLDWFISQRQHAEAYVPPVGDGVWEGMVAVPGPAPMDDSGVVERVEGRLEAHHNAFQGFQQ